MPSPSFKLDQFGVNLGPFNRLSLTRACRIQILLRVHYMLQVQRLALTINASKYLQLIRAIAAALRIEFLKIRREALDLTQRELARKIGG